MSQIYLIAPKEKSIKSSVIAFERMNYDNRGMNRIAEIYTKRISENIGIGAIAQFLMQNDINVKCVNMSIEMNSMEEIVDEIIEKAPLIVGISMIYDLHVYNAIKFVALLRRRGYQGHITLGGTFVSLAYENFLKYFRLIDTIIIGDGEGVFLDLYRAINMGENLKNIPGLALLDENGNVNYVRQKYCQNHIISTPLRETLDYALVNNIPIRTALIVGSRGCNNNCIYCSAPAMRKIHNKIWIGRNVIDLVNEIEVLINKYHIKYLYFCDDNFCGYGASGTKHLMAFVEEMKKRKLYIPFHAEIRADVWLNKENILELKSIGLEEALVGIESGVPECLLRWKKDANIRDNQNMINLLKECEVKIAPAYILFDPFTTVDELEQSYKFILENELYLEDDPWYLFNQMIVYPGTDLEEKLLKEGILKKKIINFYSINELETDENILKFSREISVIEYDIVSPKVKVIWDVLKREIDEIIEIVNISLPILTSEIRTKKMKNMFSAFSRIKKWRKNLGFLLMEFLQDAIEWGKRHADENELYNELKELRKDYDIRNLGESFEDFSKLKEESLYENTTY